MNRIYFRWLCKERSKKIRSSEPATFVCFTKWKYLSTSRTGSFALLQLHITTTSCQTNTYFVYRPCIYKNLTILNPCFWYTVSFLAFWLIFWTELCWTSFCSKFSNPAWFYTLDGFVVCIIIVGMVQYSKMSSFYPSLFAQRGHLMLMKMMAHMAILLEREEVAITSFFSKQQYITNGKKNSDDLAFNM